MLVPPRRRRDTEVNHASSSGSTNDAPDRLWRDLSLLFSKSLCLRGEDVPRCFANIVRMSLQPCQSPDMKVPRHLWQVVGASMPWYWKLRQSPRVSTGILCPGKRRNCRRSRMLARRGQEYRLAAGGGGAGASDLTVIGPELPLSLGVVDKFTQRGWRVFGPTQAAAPTGIEQEFRQGVLKASSHPDRAFRHLRFHRRSPRRIAALSHARSRKGRRTGCRQRRGDLPHKRRSR